MSDESLDSIVPPIAGPFLFPPDQFPITLRGFRQDNSEKVWERVLELSDLGPGHALAGVRIPALAKREGVPVWYEIEYADGTVTRTYPPLEP